MDDKEKELLDLLMEYRGLFLSSLLSIVSVCSTEKYKRLKQLLKELKYDKES